MFSRTQKINLSPIKQIELLASRIPDVVSLAQGIPSFDTPQVIKRAAIKALERGATAKYSLTYGIAELRETIEQKLSEDGMFYDFEKEIIVVAGSIEGITATLIALISDEKNEVLIFSPDYTSYAEAIKVAGGEPVYVGLDENQGWQIDFRKLENKISEKTAAILFSNPNNPTGTIFPKNDLLKIAELANKKQFYVISDEVYKDFIYSPQEDFFSLAQIPELRKKIIRIFSLSKAYAMAGWRIGFVHSDEENIREIVKIHDSLVTCAPVISQYAAMAALDFGSSDLEKFQKEFRVRRNLICSHLDDLSDYFSYQKPKGSYFVFPKIIPDKIKIDPIETESQTQNNSRSWQFALNLLKKARVAAVPGLAFGPAGENHIRLSFGRSAKDINRAMERIKKYLL